MDPELAPDNQELEKFGYKQQLDRSMGRFSSFAISFSLISIITGITANFSFGVQQVGGSIIWSWSLVSFGQFFVALVMADLAVRFPISGYGYQWTSRLTSAHVGFFVGWFLLMQFITGFPGVCQALAETIDFNNVNDDWYITLVTLGIISLIALVHLFSIRIVTMVNNGGVYVELLGVALLIILLWGSFVFVSNFDFANLFDTTNHETDNKAGVSSFALSLLVGAWCLTGFEAAADLAEETRDPCKTVPKAVIFSLLSAAIAGFVLIGGLLLAADSINLIQISKNPLRLILESQFGSVVANITVVIILFSIFACGVACMATATRLIYSMARDNMLPFSTYLRRIHPRYKIPRNATIAVWLLGCLFVVTVRELSLITSISTVAGYLGYCGIIWASMNSVKLKEKQGSFSLGKYRRLIQTVALIWTITVVAALTIPSNVSLGIAHLSAKSTFISLMIGITIYFFTIKNRINKGNAGPPN